MSSDFSKRTYDSSHRRARARASRLAMIDAARSAFLDQGYAATPLAQIAAAASVSVPTVYKAFGNKAGLLKALFDVSVAGDDDPIPMAERDDLQAIIREPDATRKIEKYLIHLTSAADRTMPIALLARDAGAADPEAAEVYEQMRAEMLAGMTMFAADLEATGQLAVPTDEARDILWSFHGPELYELFVVQRGWSIDRYRDFLTATLVRALIEA